MANNDPYDQLMKFAPIFYRKTALSDVINDSDQSLEGYVKRLQEGAPRTIESTLANIAQQVKTAGQTIEQLAKTFVIVAKNAPKDAKPGAAEASKQGAATPDEVLEPNPDRTFRDGKLNACVFMVNSAPLHPSIMNAREAQIFYNLVPTVELSRCVPYFDIQLQPMYGARAQTKSQTLARPSILRFLQNPFNVSKATGADKLMADAMSNPTLTKAQAARQAGGKAQDTAAFYNKGVLPTGIEYFTSPQTLVNPYFNEFAGSSRYRPAVLDPFSPLATIESVKISAESTRNEGFGVYPVETAEISFKVHDRSRMSELGDFFAPSGYSGYALRLTYGWAHPDQSPDNVYSRFMNSMRKTSVFKVLTTSFSSGQDGSLKLNVKLVSAASLDFVELSLSEDTMMSYKSFNDRISQVLNLINEANGKPDKKSKPKISQGHVFKQASDQFASQPEVMKELRPFIDKLLRKPSVNDIAGDVISNKEAAEFLQKLEEAYGKAGVDGKKSSDTVPNLRNQVDGHIRRKLEGLLYGPDPYAYAITRPKGHSHSNKDIMEVPEIGYPGDDKALLDISSGKTRYVSLGKIVQNLAFPALMNGSLLIDEIQAFFYTANSNAGEAKGVNLASFMIDIEHFRQEYSKYAASQGSLDFSISSFFVFISSYLSDVNLAFYGVARRDSGDANDKQKTKKSSVKKSKTTGKAAADSGQNENLKGSDFRPIVLKTHFEAQPIVEGTSTTRKLTYRLFVIDAVTSPYEDIEMIASAALHEGLQKITSLSDSAAPLDVIKAAIESKTIAISPRGFLTINTGTRSLIEFLKSHMPSITVGANNSMVIDASFSDDTSSNERSARISVMLQQGGKLHSLPASSGQGMPLLVPSTKVSLTTFGFPLMRPWMKIFIDFMTNSGVDSPYAAIKYTHDITPGQFKTSYEFAHPTSYQVYQNPLNRIDHAIGSLKKSLEGEKK